MLAPHLARRLESGELDKIASQVNGIMLAEFSYSDIDRFNTFYKIAKKNNRCLAVSLKQTFVLDAVHGDKHIYIFNRSVMMGY